MSLGAIVLVALAIALVVWLFDRLPASPQKNVALVVFVIVAVIVLMWMAGIFAPKPHGLHPIRIDGRIEGNMILANATFALVTREGVKYVVVEDNHRIRSY